MVGDPFYQDVRLLLSGDGADGGTAFNDLGPLAYPVATSGNAKTSAVASAFNGSAIVLDGSGDFLTIAAASNWPWLHAANGKFTWEARLKPDTFAHANTLFSTVDGTSTAVGLFAYINAARDVSVQITYGSAGNFIVNALFAAAYPNDLAAFHHVEIGWDHSVPNNNLLLFIDGALVGTASKTANTPSEAWPQRALRIGTMGVGGTDFQGALESVRVTANRRRHTAAFVPPAEALPAGMGVVSGTIRDAAGQLAARTVRAIRRGDGMVLGETYSGPADASFDSVVLLLTGDGPDGLPLCVDRSSYKNPITFNGDAKVSAARRKFVGASLLFDGVGDFLSAPNSGLFSFESGNFTAEAWIYRTVGGASQGLFSTRPVAAQSGWVLRINADNTLQLFYTGGSSVVSVAQVPVNQWTHVAAVRDGATAYLFVDGVLVATGAFANGTTSAEPLRIGVESGALASGWFAGSMSGIRLTKGLARYTGGFAVPTDRHPVRSSGALGDYSFYTPTLDEVTILALDNETAGTIYNDLAERVLPA